MWWPFKKKKKQDRPDPLDISDEEEPEEEEQNSDDDGVSAQIEKVQADITKITGSIESFKEMRKSTAERFATINEQIGELRGQVNDTQRSVGTIEVKATKAADLVESVHPDKLMIQVQKEDGKIEGLRGMLEAKEDMMRNIMDQLKKLRDQMNLFRGVEQVIKLNEEVKNELMTIKRVTADAERHADRVENVYVEAQKSFDAFNNFADKLDNMKTDIKEAVGKIDKLEIAQGSVLKKSEFEERIEKIERHDKKIKKVLEEVEEYYSKLDGKFKEMEGKLKGSFEAKLERAELLSKGVDDLLEKNPLFAKGLKLEEYLQKRLSGEPEEEQAPTEAPAEGVENEEGDGEEEKPAEK